MKRLVAVTFACFALAGCGLNTNTVLHNQPLWCTYHAWRLERDIRHHHRGWAVFQAVLTAHHCSKALGGLGL